MHPTALMQALMDVVPCIKVTAKDSAEVLADQLFDHFPPTRMMVFIIATAWGTYCPDVAIEAIFSPPRFIGLDRWTRADRRFERIEAGLHVGFEPVEQLHNLSTADRDPVQREQVRLNLSNGQSHHRAQGGDQTGQSHSEASLTDHLLMQVQRGFMPFLTARTPALVDPMFRHLNWRRRRNIDDLSAARQTQASQTQMAGRASQQTMLHDLSGPGARSPSIMPRLTLFACLLLFLWQFLLLRFDERWWRRFQLLQFLNAPVGFAQLLGEPVIFAFYRTHLRHMLALSFLHHTQVLQHLAELLFQLCNLFVLRHARSLTEKVHSEQYHGFLSENTPRIYISHARPSIL